ncbi:MAG: hypothetical protein ACLFM7_03460 [Bacteroidales bacterium]
MRLIVLSLFLPILPFTAFTQNLPEQLGPPSPPVDTPSLFLSIDNTNFFKNNEFDNDYVAGYSKPGFFINPSLVWVISDDTQMGGGINLLKYFGEGGFNQVRPIFYLQHRLWNGIDLRMGSIKSTRHHNLIDPLYHYERFLDENTENGLQFLIDKPFVRADVWLNWKNFITHGDDSREIFETGISSEWPLYAKHQDFNINFPLQAIFEHKGGQIDHSGKPVSTLANFAAGPSLELDLASGILTSLEWETMYVGYRYLSPGDIRNIQKGHGLMSALSVNMQSFQCRFIWWDAKRFFSFAGNPMYQTYSIRKELFVGEKRELLVGKLRYTRKYQDLHFIFNLDTYWSPPDHQMDYGFGIYLLLNTDLFLKKVNKRRNGH